MPGAASTVCCRLAAYSPAHQMSERRALVQAATSPPYAVNTSEATTTCRIGGWCMLESRSHFDFHFEYASRFEFCHDSLCMIVQMLLYESAIPQQKKILKSSLKGDQSPPVVFSQKYSQICKSLQYPLRGYSPESTSKLTVRRL